jgi:hypothetical protein
MALVAGTEKVLHWLMERKAKLNMARMFDAGRRGRVAITKAIIKYADEESRKPFANQSMSQPTSEKKAAIVELFASAVPPSGPLLALAVNESSVEIVRRLVSLNFI